MSESAEQLHQAGKLREAEIRYRARLSADPNDALALRGLGIIAGQTGQLDQAAGLLIRSATMLPDQPQTLHPLGLVLLSLGRVRDAVTIFRRVTEVEPDFPDAHNSLGAALKKQGEVDGAIAAYRKALLLRPNFPEAANNLAIALQERGDLEQAVELYQRAVKARPSYPEALSNLGNALRMLGRLDESVSALRRAVALKAGVAELHYNLGIALQQAAAFADAVIEYEKALAIKPDYVEALNNLGNARLELMDYEGATANYRKALELRLDLADAHNNLGRALRELGSIESAVSAYRRSIEIDPSHADAHSNLGNALRELGDLDAAEIEFRAALNANPGFVEAEWNLGLVSLLRGEFESGFKAYELRHKVKESYVDPKFLSSFWDGSDLNGRTILLLCEQGLGDTIHFIRYAPLIKRLGGRVLVLAQPRLVKLLNDQPGIGQVITVGEEVPPFDVACPLMSLPRVFQTTLDTVPNHVPYLTANVQKAQAWRKRLNSHMLNVGLVWAGNPTFRNDRLRSIELPCWQPILQTAGVHWISLQKGAAGDQAQGLPINDWTSELEDFEDTAALISQLDLVISVDTAVAHLAGALGKATWILIPFAPDWRWMLDRDDSPWYPTMRLFRQPTRGDWITPIQRIAAQLRELARKGRSRS